MVGNWRRWPAGALGCLILLGPQHTGTAFADFSATTSTTGKWSAATTFPDGNLMAWDRNDSGQLGLGDTTDRTSPAQLTGRTASVVATGPDSSTTLAIT
ncbi:RCC1 domain-containing protein [Nonomuraea lactucae]|uniref:RCC1 domain-containing protein n=1 Tax=Nonomuraea lactucae TaxID=2249762 RepID=UPI000DE32B2C|nr:RCC1 domain-containing protein [Nonomuraea lactucae]